MIQGILILISEKRCVEHYSVGPNHGQKAVQFKCDDNSEACQCVQSRNLCVVVTNENEIK